MFKNFSVARAIAVIIFIYSLVVMAGWIFDIDPLTTIFPNQNAMTFITAFGFFVSAIALWFINDAVMGSREIPLLVLPATSLLTLLIVITIVASGIFGAYTGLVDLFVAGNMPVNLTPGIPAIMTIVAFILFDADAIYSLFLDMTVVNKNFLYAGAIIVIIGAVAILGYTINIPLLYYRFSGDSSPMALNTAITFALLGSGLILSETSKKK